MYIHLIISSNWDSSSHEVKKNYFKIYTCGGNTIKCKSRRGSRLLRPRISIDAIKAMNIQVSWSNAFSSRFFFFMLILIAEWSWDKWWLSTVKDYSATSVYCLKLRASNWVQNTRKHILYKNNSYNHICCNKMFTCYLKTFDRL